MDQQSTAWIVDSGATDHVMNDKTILTSSTQCTRFVKTAGRTLIRIMAKGQVIINVNGCKVHLNNVLYVPNASVNLMSVQALANDSRDSSQQQTSKQRHYQNDLTPMININHGNSAMTSSMNDVAILGMIRHR
ncbi:hypothetical protein NDA11_006857 [Ustilago hordei]|uniref:Retrovirus-related Pol polyprotein from transposon TNT 1-94-like beta-barrel domain-containing protein n=1 Tax=Ustilago hordei TaxID=120017 RepID=I2G179_USTHO|nr:hypothetical protein NDA15_005330 [Ustilago hordei]KAJ1588807.1 hypothetical protein NDA11_006857 [Ustilago hordei]KAJ1599762.1 hypothetical protein NDA14_001830 [Ustilago hordei]UTT92350.1 hypothetical protein NDA17_007204 [Ustilago hordei]CCF52922.1 uncharacterized protein UHOR_15735 [Ustilago hordei]